MPKISAYTDLNPVDNADVIVVNDVSATITKKATKANFLADIKDGTGINNQAIKPKHMDFGVVDATARDALASPFEGMTVYRKDLDCFQFYTGTRWRYVMPRQLELQYGTGGPTVLTASYVDQLTTSSLTTLGGLVEIEANVFAYNAGSGADRTMDVLLLCDGATVGTFLPLSVPLNATANGWYEFTLKLQHTPTAGAHVWKIQARGSTAAAVGFVNASTSLKVTEIG